MNAAANSSVIIAVLVIAGSSVTITVILYWIARNLISSSHSLEKLIESVKVNVNVTIEMLQKSIGDINRLTSDANGKMEKLDAIIDNVEELTADVKSATDMINRTVTPSLGNIQALSAGMRKAVETWNEYGDNKVDNNEKE